MIGILKPTMTTEVADHCPSGGSASQSPDTAAVPHLHNNNNNNNQNRYNNNKTITPWNSTDLSHLTSSDYLDDVFYDSMRVEVQRKGRKVKQKNRRQIVQQHYDALVQLVPVLKNRTSQSALTKNAILKSTVQYINQLKESSLSSSHHLKEELRLEWEHHARLQNELTMWREKVQQLKSARDPKQQHPPHKKTCETNASMFSDVKCK